MTPAASVLTSGATGGVLATVVRSTFEIAVAVGLDRASLLARIGVNEATLADPNAWVPIEAHTRLWEALGELPSAGTLSLVLAQSLQLDMLGVVGWAMMNAPVAGDLIRIGTRYASLFGDPYTPQIEDTDEAMIVRRVFEPRLVRTRVLPEYAPAASVQMFRDLAAIQPGEPLALAMWFQHEAPGDVAAHERFFGCPVRWSAPETRLVVAREAAERPIVQRNPELYAYLDRHALALAGTTAASASLSERVRAIIAGAIQGGEPAPAAVAKQLGMSERTLQRRLRDESRTFADILDAVRRELSVRYLSDPKLAVFEIAFLLGYAETSSFHRAFKRWTGEGPQEFRARPAAR